MDVILTGDRPTGKLHLGHYVGSLKRRVELQNSGKYHNIYIMIADAQALTDNADNINKVRNNISEVALDYLSCGLDPQKSTIFKPQLSRKRANACPKDSSRLASITIFFNCSKVNDGGKTAAASSAEGLEIL